MTFLPQKLKQAGYKTAHAGKWHLGSASRRQLPVNRGFDSSFGFLDGMEDHLNHRMVRVRDPTRIHVCRCCAWSYAYACVHCCMRDKLNIVPSSIFVCSCAHVLMRLLTHPYTHTHTHTHTHTAHRTPHTAHRTRTHAGGLFGERQCWEKLPN